ncbi:Cold-shock DNA-binding domain protein [Planktothrix tepida]|uniref:Cold-shock DNA-binding domain protein n=2 Tax=Planktothrix TaxID=54304 RepID=A0A1J1LV90_9CYAN
MKVPVEITYRDVEKTDYLDELINKKVAKLERYCNYMSSCRVVVEKIHDRPKSGSPYRVRLDITVPPGHELAASENPQEGVQYESLKAVIRDVFEAARRQLVELVQRQRDEVKTHTAEEVDSYSVPQI